MKKMKKMKKSIKSQTAGKRKNIKMPKSTSKKKRSHKKM